MNAAQWTMAVSVFYRVTQWDCLVSPNQVLVAAQVFQFDGLDLIAVKMKLMKAVREVWGTKK